MKDNIDSQFTAKKTNSLDTKYFGKRILNNFTSWTYRFVEGYIFQYIIICVFVFISCLFVKH